MAELRYLTSNYLAFAESQLQQYQTNPVFEATRKSCPDTLGSYIQKVRIAAHLRNQFLALAEVEETFSSPTDPEFIEKIAAELEFFLTQRLKWLVERQVDYQAFKKQIPLLNAGASIRIGYVPTFPDEVRKYPQGGLYHEIALMTLMDFRILNRIIRELYEMLPLSAIPVKTRVLLRASASLHPFLLRQSLDPGYPELGFLLDTRSENTRNTSGDLVYYFSYIVKKPYWVKDMMLGAPRGHQNLLMLTQAEAFEFHPKKVLQPYPLPVLRELIEPVASQPVQAVGQENSAGEVAQPSEGPSVEGRIALGENREGLEVTSPFIVAAPSEKNLEILRATSSMTLPAHLVKIPTAPSTETEPAALPATQNLKDVCIPVVGSSDMEPTDWLKEIAQVEAEVEQACVAWTPQVSLSEHHNMEAELDEESEVRAKAGDLPKGESDSATRRDRPKLTRKVRATEVAAPAPRFRRLFHAEQTQVGAAKHADLSLLSRTQHGWLEDLFHHRLKVVRYRDFKSVWLTLKGKVRSETEHGGSHFDLRDSDDRWVGGIFAHNEGQEYSKPYHPVLRDAFAMIGVSKDRLNPKK